MSRFLAIDWNESELRAVVANVRGGTTQIVRVGNRDWPPSGAEKHVDTNTMAGSLRDWCAETGSGKLTALVALDRSFVDLHELNLPPAPLDELPDLVRFQVQREVSTLDEHSPLDYIVLNGGEAEPYHVLAATIRPELVERITQVCVAAGIRLRRLVFRPCATASLAHRRSQTPNDVQLVVHPVRSDVDMAVMDRGSIQMIRSVRLQTEADPTSTADALVGEVRRTVISARQQLGDRRIESIIICGSSDRDAKLAQRLAEELERNATVLDPLEAWQAVPLPCDSPSEGAGQFAPLVGMVLDEADDKPPILDFLNPHHRPAERSIKTTIVLAAVALVMLSIWYGLWQYGRIASADEGIADATEQLRQLEPTRKKGKTLVEQADRIAAWVQTDAVWLDELARLSQSLRPELLNAKEYPVDRDIVTNHLHMELKPRTGDVQIDLDAVARTREAVAPFEHRLRDDGHRVDIVSGNAGEDRPGYRWEFKTKVQIETTQVGPGRE